MSKLKYYQVHSFIGENARGNPAGVVLADNELDAPKMLEIAQDIGHSETAFLVPNAAGDWNIRYFAPGGEVELCGHATLAAGFVLNQLYHKDSVCLTTTQISIDLEVREGDVSFVIPAQSMASIESGDDCPRSLEQYPLEKLYYGNETYILVLDSQSEVDNFVPPLNAIKSDKVYFAITARHNEAGFDYCSRFFAPHIGINEDPVTGSLAALLTPFWAVELKKNDLTSIQLSSRRGVLKTNATGNEVKVSGRASILVDGDLKALL